MEPVADVHFILGDFREQSVLEELEAAVGGRKLDLVLSDMAPTSPALRQPMLPGLRILSTWQLICLCPSETFGMPARQMF